MITPTGGPIPDCGLFIAFEGLDGSGKSTQAALLFKELSDNRPLKPKLLKEPTEGPIGQFIRQSNGFRLDPKEEIKLFVQDRSIDLEENIIPALNEGRTVIIDRYILSNVAYQGALCSPKEVLEANQNFLWPHLTFILEIDVLTGLSRAKKRGPLQTAFENAPYLDKVKAIYDAFDGPGLIRLNAKLPIEEIFTSITFHVRKLLTD
ncbi:MAG: dTMP kinase [Deltaproteobacteria bacterium]|nr:dTMP kinase [Deltaproteobacteria bacterium]